MARSRAKLSTKRIGRQAQGKQPQGIEKRSQHLRRSARLQKPQLQNNELKHLLPSPPITAPPNTKAPPRLPLPTGPEAVSPLCTPYELEANRKLERKRKRSQEVDVPQEGPLGKRPRAENSGDQSSYRTDYWLQEGKWPKEYFESGNQTWKDLKADTIIGKFEADGMNDLIRPLLARKKSVASLRRQALEASTTTPTEKAEDKSLPYRSLGYEDELAIKGSHLVESLEGISEDSKLVCQSLLITAQAVPQDTLFRDDLLKETCNRLRNRNEARIVEDISPLVAPSAETLAIYGATELKHLIFNINERWGESIPVTDTRPQPDRCVGFSRSAFTADQLQRLKPFVGGLVPINYFSFFLATWRMYFPFFACEAKSGIGELDVADKQNAHSMSMAVRGIVELFKLARCEEELHRKVLAFSISHDDKIVRIYGYYAIIKERKANFYRHPIRTFDFTEQDGKDKWTAYQFTKNVYFEFMPKLHELICSAIDKISLDPAPQDPALPPQILLGDSFCSTDLESEQADSQEMAASAPPSQDSTGFKRKRLTANAVLQQQLAQRDEHSQALNMLRQELEQQRQESREQLESQRRESREQLESQRRESEQQRQESEQQIRKLMDTISAIAEKSQRARKK